MTVTAPTATRDRLLRLAMRADAVLTGLAGLAALPLAATLAEWSGTSTTIEYSLAAFFIGYGVVVFGLSLLPSVREAGLVVIAANLAYTVAAVLIVVTDVWSMTGTGIALTLATGVYTAVFAELQYVGWRRL
ncbi:hypothetical protein NIIDNTM18_40000 [Mycolicibacterium litorale]|uniref:Integral membrane protein n=1 Tax=Mycolicibacterium litorale TaxID=758802 RepID=A0A6S6P9D4_9MYCO|nr:hypothetical protein [Mycolicibacterium litorale]BCI54722.1 hypothetical protein NIIDNTM18_40000 [Mycolicibacterium litorale]